MEMKLTKKQKQVVTDIFNGAVFVCDSEIKGAYISGNNLKEDYHINNGVFFRLVKKRAIYQQIQMPFNYVLSRKCIEMLKLHFNKIP